MKEFLLSCVTSADHPATVESATQAEDLMGTQGITTIEILVHRIKSSTLSYLDLEGYLSSTGFNTGDIGKIRYRVKQMVMDLEDQELEMQVNGAANGGETMTDRGGETSNPLAGGGSAQSPTERLADAQKVMMDKIAAATAKGDNDACTAATREYAALAQTISAEMTASAMSGSIQQQQQSMENAAAAQAVEEAKMIQAMQMVDATKRQSVRRPRSSISQASNELEMMKAEMEMMKNALKNVAEVPTGPRAADGSKLDVFNNEEELEACITTLYTRYKAGDLDLSFVEESDKARTTINYLELKDSVYACAMSAMNTKLVMAMILGTRKERGTEVCFDKMEVEKAYASFSYDSNKMIDIILAAKTNGDNTDTEKFEKIVGITGAASMITFFLELLRQVADANTQKQFALCGPGTSGFTVAIFTSEGLLGFYEPALERALELYDLGAHTLVLLSLYSLIMIVMLIALTKPSLSSPSDHTLITVLFPLPPSL